MIKDMYKTHCFNKCIFIIIYLSCLGLWEFVYIRLDSVLYYVFLIRVRLNVPSPMSIM